MPGGHYVDLANDLVAMPRLLSLHEAAAAADRTVVTGTGFGVLATEVVVARLCGKSDTVPGARRRSGFSCHGSRTHGRRLRNLHRRRARHWRTPL